VKPFFSLLNAVPTSTTQLVLLGSGAREHALSIKLSQDGATVHVLPGNAAPARASASGYAGYEVEKPCK